MEADAGLDQQKLLRVGRPLKLDQVDLLQQYVKLFYETFVTSNFLKYTDSDNKTFF